MFVSEKEDLDFLIAYLAGLVITLGIEYVITIFVNDDFLLLDVDKSRCTGQ